MSDPIATVCEEREAAWSMNWRREQEQIMMINLYKAQEGDYYMAQHIGDQKLVNMFGTDTFLTGFTGRSKPEVIYATMQRLNPGHVVVLTHGRMEPVAPCGSSGNCEEDRVVATH